MPDVSKEDVTVVEAEPDANHISQAYVFITFSSFRLVIFLLNIKLGFSFIDMHLDLLRIYMLQ